MQPIYYGNCTSNHCFDIPMVLILSMVWQYLAFFCWIFTWTSSHVLGLMTNTMLAILYLQSHAVLLWCIQGASYVFYISILNIRLSCERYRKNMVRAWTKILWWMGIRSTFLMGEPFLLTLLWLNSLSPGYIKLYVYIQGRLFIHFGRDISITLSSIPLCVTSIMLFPKPITYTSADIIYVLCTNM